jgi:hypothetical protein
VACVLEEYTGTFRENEGASSVISVFFAFGPLPPSTSPLNGFLLLAVGLLSLLCVPAQIQKMNFRFQWAKLVLELLVLLFFVVTGLVKISQTL